MCVNQWAGGLLVWPVQWFGCSISGGGETNYFPGKIVCGTATVGAVGEPSFRWMWSGLVPGRNDCVLMGARNRNCALLYYLFL